MVVVVGGRCWRTCFSQILNIRRPLGLGEFFFGMMGDGEREARMAGP